MEHLNQADVEHFRNIGLIKIGKETSAEIIENIKTQVEYLKLPISTCEKDELFLKNPLFMQISGIINGNTNDANAFFEYWPKRSLKKLLELNKSNLAETFTKTQKYIILLGIAIIIQHIHINDLYHGNLDLNSIFLDDDFYPHICYFPNLVKEQIDNYSFAEHNNNEILDMNSFCYIAYEIMTEKKCFNDDMNGINFLDQNFDLTLIEEEWIKNFLKKCWPGYNNYLTISDIINEIRLNKNEFGNLDEEQINNFLNKIQSFQNEYSSVIKEKADANDIRSIILYGKMLQYGYCIPINKKQASQYYKKGSLYGDTNAKYLYGMMLKNGEGIQVNIEKALIYLKEASNFNHCGALYEYGILLCKTNKKKGIELIQQAAKDKYLIAIEKIALLYQNINISLVEEFCQFSLSYGYILPIIIYASLIREKDQNESNKLFMKAVSLNFPIAMHFYGKSLFDEGNKEEGIRYIKMAADMNYPDSCFLYGRLLIEGKYLEKDYINASRYIKNAADNGNEDATNLYGLMLRDGVGVDKNISEAVKYFRLAIADGNAAAMYNYGILILNEKGIDGDSEDGSFYINESAKRGFKPALILLIKSLFIFPNGEDNEMIEEIRKMAEEGDSESMYNYAVMLSNGEGMQVDKQKAAHFYQEAAEKGHIGSMNNYAFMLKNGDGIQQDKQDAIKYFKMAADNGHIISMFQLAVMLIEENNNINEGLMYLAKAVDEGYIDAAFYMKSYFKFEEHKNEEEENFENDSFTLMRDAENGNINSMFTFGVRLLFGIGMYKSRPDAAEYFKRASELGHIGAMNKYGEMLFNGIGIPKNKEKAAQLFKQASEKGHVIAMYNYAKMLFNGDGVTKNKIESAKYYKRAADQGHSGSANNYGVMLSIGNGIPINKETSLKYLKKAAEGFNSTFSYNYGFIKLTQNNGNDASESISFIKKSADEGMNIARKQYGDILYDGIGIPIDKKEALKYYKMAADDGDMECLFKYSEMVENGDGVEINIEEAMKYYQKAFLTNDPKAAERIRRLTMFYSYAA